MVRGWATSVGRIIASEPGKKWYWFLLSKGHRTYMYLPLFFNEYYPSANGSLANPLLEILETTAQRLYDGCYKQASGLIVFDRKMGELKSIHTQSTYEKQHKPHVKLFLRLNPYFHQGDELVCLTHLHPDNMRGYAKKYMLEGMAQNL